VDAHYSDCLLEALRSLAKALEKLDRAEEAEVYLLRGLHGLFVINASYLPLTDSNPSYLFFLVCAHPLGSFLRFCTRYSLWCGPLLVSNENI